MNFCVLIPAYNEAGAIERLLDSVKLTMGERGVCVVVDDCSSDETSEIVRRKNVTLLKQTPRQGKGQALRTGFHYILKQDFDPIVIIDGDGQHDPEDIPRFLKRLEEGPFDIVVGDRMHNPDGMPWARRVTNRVMSTLLSMRIGVRVPDSQCGFRALRRSVLEKLDFSSSKFEIDSEMLVRSVRAGFKIGAVPIRSVYGQEISRIRPIRDGVRFLRFYLKDLFHV